ncbi:hypothetical protein PROFUN_08330 [Planoprotostelium fungivorum]|uniref:CNNM transmembrane domain-containing protein n=1 Tax=Planoprotostelium fungivorum TaxID=1890364 RepID=A0A2P6NI37_9EUKA|nr:hypothetical protein PROFUN_08330 [Planoprotostelium fungivorum]
MEHHEDLTPATTLLYSGVSIFLVCTSGMMSGLTVGLLSLDQMNLQILSHSGDVKQKKYASGIIPILKNRHHLMVTLLLCNACAMEALPIFLDKLTDPVIAIIVSVTAVLLFGEIIPQALCVRYGLAIGFYTSWLVRALMYATFPISYPIGLLLDRLLGGDHGEYYKRSELKELVTMHAAVNQGPLSIDECNIINGALDMKTKTVKDCMTSLEKVFMVGQDEVFDEIMSNNLISDGHSRVPVYRDNRNNIVGLLLVKHLLGVSTDKRMPIKQIGLRPLPGVLTDKPLYDMLNEFQTGRSHMATVTDSSRGELVGIITLEDVIEELIQEEIEDETDAMPAEEKSIKLRRLQKHLTPVVTPEQARSQGRKGSSIEVASLLAHSSNGDNNV